MRPLVELGREGYVDRHLHIQRCQSEKIAASIHGFYKDETWSKTSTINLYLHKQRYWKFSSLGKEKLTRVVPSTKKLYRMVLFIYYRAQNVTRIYTSSAHLSSLVNHWLSIVYLFLYKCEHFEELLTISRLSFLSRESNFYQSYFFYYTWYKWLSSNQERGKRRCKKCGKQIKIIIFILLN